MALFLVESGSKQESYTLLHFGFIKNYPLTGFVKI